jgi:hypothetical protein
MTSDPVASRDQSDIDGLIHGAMGERSWSMRASKGNPSDRRIINLGTATVLHKHITPPYPSVTSDLSGSKSSRLSPYGLISLSPCGLAVHTHTMDDKSERRTLYFCQVCLILRVNSYKVCRYASKSSTSHFTNL